MRLPFLATWFTLLFAIPAFAGQGINYQAVARNAAGVPATNTTVALKFTIYSDTTIGTIVYQETHTTPTSSFGIITIIVGGGTTIQGDFDSIDWSTEKFLQVEFDATGGINYTHMGITKVQGAMFSSYASKATTAGSADFALNAVHALTATSALLADSALNSAHAQTAESAALATTAINASHSLTSDNALYADTAIAAVSAVTSNHSLTADVALYTDSATNAATATNAMSANHSLTSDNALHADTASAASTAITSNHSLTSDVALQADSATHAATATNSMSASHALVADNAVTATTALSATGIAVYYAENIPISSTTNTVPQDMVSLTLQPGTYLLTFSAMVASTNGSGLTYKFDTGLNVFTGISVLPSSSTSDFTNVSSTMRVTNNAATTVKIQYCRNMAGGGAAAYMQNATITAIATN